MEATSDPVSHTTSKRPYRTIAERRGIVEETLAPGASVSKIARAHGVNANQLFGWRKMYHEGRLSDANPRRRPQSNASQRSNRCEADTVAVRLLPVTVTAEIEPTSDSVVIPDKQAINDARLGTIELTLAKARVRITGAVDAAALRTILESLHS
jgi:transposase